MHWQVQHLQGEIDKSSGELFHGNNKQNLWKKMHGFFLDANVFKHHQAKTKLNSAK